MSLAEILAEIGSASFLPLVGGMLVGYDESFEVLNPAEESVVARCPLLTEAGLGLSVEAATRAGADWMGRTWTERGALIERLADLMIANWEPRWLPTLVSLRWLSRVRPAPAKTTRRRRAPA